MREAIKTACHGICTNYCNVMTEVRLASPSAGRTTCGKDLQWWKEFFSVVHMMGYEGGVSLEMEDMTMSMEAGVNASIDALRQTISQ